jgi:hypothetical protein
MPTTSGPRSLALPGTCRTADPRRRCGSGPLFAALRDRCHRDWLRLQHRDAGPGPAAARRRRGPAVAELGSPCRSPTALDDVVASLVLHYLED